MDHSLPISLPYELCEEVLLFAGNLILALSSEREGNLESPTNPPKASHVDNDTNTDTDTHLIQLLSTHPPSRRLLRSLCPHLSWFTASHALSAYNLRLFELLVEAKYYPKNHRRSLEWAFVHGDIATLDYLRLTIHNADPSWHIPPELVWLTCLCVPQSKAVETLNWWIKCAPRKTQLVNLRHGSSSGRLRDVSEIPCTPGGTHTEMYLKDWFLKSGLYPHHMYQCVTRPCSAIGAVDLLQWWKTHGAEKMGMACQDSELDVASANGHVDVLRWWCATGWELKWTERAMDEAARNGFVHVLEWWVNESRLRPIRYTEKMWAAADSHVVVKEWLRSKSELSRGLLERVDMAANCHAENGLAESFASVVTVQEQTPRKSFDIPTKSGADSSISRRAASATSGSRSKSRSPGRVKWDCVVSDSQT